MNEDSNPSGSTQNNDRETTDISRKESETDGESGRGDRQSRETPASNEASGDAERSGPVELNRRDTLRAIASASLLPGIAATATQAAAESGTIVDSEDSSAVSVTGTWPTSTYNSNYIGSNYRSDDNSGKGSKSVQYTPDLPNDGPYNIFLYWNSSSGRATAAPVDIDYDGGSTTVTVDQTEHGGQWNHIGTHPFTSGTGESVTIRNDGTSEYVIADAVNFARALLDSEDSSGVSITGSWTNSTFSPGYEGDNYKHDNNGGKGDKAVAYDPTIPEPGSYEVYLKWTDGDNRASNVPVEIAGDCTKTVTIDQTKNGGQWNSIGNFRLDANSTITIKNDGTDGYVIADAVKVIPISVGSSAVPDIYVNQAGYDKGRPKRFTAPDVADGTSFEIRTNCDTVYQGTISDKVGDFTDFEPEGPGPFTVTLEKDGVTIESPDFRIDDHETQLTNYKRALEFMTGCRTEQGDYSALPSDPNDYFAGAGRALGWLDENEYSMVLSGLADLYMANPEGMEDIRLEDGDEPDDLDEYDPYTYTNMPTSVPDDTPEVVRLLWWGAHVYLKADVNYSILKSDLAAFLRVYPEVSEWIPQSLYDDVYDHLFPIWTQSTGERHYEEDWASVDHDKDLTTTYTQRGTSKGDFPVGFSVRGNLDMYEVAKREGRNDAQIYLDAAVEQVEWIVNNVDVTDDRFHKGLRMSEHPTVTGVVRLLKNYPDEVPSGTQTWLTDWAAQMNSLSDNLWDFRKSRSDRWIVHYDENDNEVEYNEPGNVMGFPAPALAAANAMDEYGDSSNATDLRRNAQAHVDNAFGRNPPGRPFGHRANQAEYGYDGVERAWFEEDYGAYGLNWPVPGAMDGSPPAAQYPHDPDADEGYTESWVAFQSAWNTALAWLSYDDSDIEIVDSNGEEIQSVSASETITVRLNTATTSDTADIQLTVGSQSNKQITLARESTESAWFETDVDLANQGAEDGDDVVVKYASGVFSTVDTVSVGDGSPSTVVVDNKDSGATFVGNWPSSTFEDEYVGDDYQHDDNSGKGEKTATFTPGLDAAGEYDIYAYWNNSEVEEDGRATDVHMDINYDGGSDTVTVDQTQNGGQWNKLGTYSFTSGTGESVTIRNDGTSDYIVADAVKFVPV